MSHAVIDAQVFATLLAIAAAILGTLWMEQRRLVRQFQQELRALEERLASELQRLDRRITRAELTLGPLQAGIEQHLSRLLVRSNPFTPAETAAGARFLRGGPQNISTADLRTLERALSRELADPQLDDALRVGFGMMHGAIAARLALRAREVSGGALAMEASDARPPR